MEKWIEDLFTQDILEEAAKRYSCSIANSKKLGDFENYVFEVHRNGAPYILRLTHSSHRSYQEVRAELEWINYLHDKGVNVSLVNHSNQDELVEVIEAHNSHFYICLFDKAPGKPVSVKEDLFNEDLFEKWGRITGSMHRVTKEYQPGENQRKRWDEDDLLDYEKYLSQLDDAVIIEKGKENNNRIEGYPETLDTFGLIHSDIHPGNFFYDTKDIHVFDFDDSTQFFFLSDIAIPLYYSVWMKLRNEDLETRSAFGESFLSAFLKGYLDEFEVEEEWIKNIPVFLELRDLSLYTVFHKKWDMENLSEVEESIVSQIRKRLLSNEPIVDLNYQAILATARKK